MDDARYFSRMPFPPGFPVDNQQYNGNTYSRMTNHSQAPIEILPVIPILRKEFELGPLPEGSNTCKFIPTDSNINISIPSGSYGTVVSTMTEMERNNRGYKYLWGGARATVGVEKGAYCYECRILSLARDSEEEDFASSVCRLGWSLEDAAWESLGEDDYSFGYDSRGLSSTSNTFTKFGEVFGLNDVIGCLIDLDKLSISFTKNGLFLGRAFHIPESLRGKVFYPHVLLRNASVRFNFHPPSIVESFPDYIPGSYIFVGMAQAANYKHSTARIIKDETDILECIMLVGLPSTGKSRWVADYISAQPEKMYTLVSREQILKQMKLDSLANDKQRVDELRKFVPSILSSYLEHLSKKMTMAGSRPYKNVQSRNYIFDQTNCYQSARQRRLKIFNGLGFVKIAKVFCPDEETHALFRASLSADGEHEVVSSEELHKMEEAFELPELGSVEFDRIDYIDTTKEEAEKIVQAFRARAKQSKKRPVPSPDVSATFVAPPPGLAAEGPYAGGANPGEVADYATAMAQYHAYMMIQQQIANSNPYVVAARDIGYGRESYYNPAEPTNSAYHKDAYPSSQ